MITLRKATARGCFDHGWLRTCHTFSFADYHDPAHMGFRVLRVLNEDHIAAGQGFGTHPHRDMEILTWVLSGALEHRDSTGNGAVIRPGEVQIMSAGTGIQHSEQNASAREPVHLLQIWIVPRQRGLLPRYAQAGVQKESLADRLAVLAAPPGERAIVAIHQDVRVLATDLAPGRTIVHALAPGRGAWVQVASGRLHLNGTELRAGDGASVTDEAELRLAAASAAHALVFDLG